MDLYELRWARAGLSYARAEALTGVSARTWRRWEADGSAPPWAPLLCGLLGGEVAALPEAGPAWAGWRWAGGELVSPEGDTVRPADVRALPWQRQLLAEYQRQDRARRSGPPAVVVPLTPARIARNLTP